MSAQTTNRIARSRHDYQPPAFTIQTMQLSFDLQDTATRVRAVMQIKRQSPGAALRLDGQQLTLLAIALNGQPLNSSQYQLLDDGIIVSEVPDSFELFIETELAPQHNTALEGLYMAGNTYCTQCEAEGFRRIMFFPDRPDVLCQYTVTIKADAEKYPYLLSNGNKVSEHVDEQGCRIVQWHDPYPKPCYLFALVAGDFDLLTDNFTTQSGRDVRLELFVDKGASVKGDFALQALKRAMRWDEQRFNLEYDLDIYMVVAVDFFNMGAMENKGLNIFNSKYVLADAASATDRDYFNIESIIGHEYFHNWTGNRVTCRDWFQLSLKEGLTVFRDQEFSADMGSATLCRIDAVKLIRSAQFAEDASPMAHPIRPEQVLEMNNFYTVTVYDKGAEVIRMLQTLLGRDRFAAGLALYLKRHDGQAATCDDFIQAMQDASDYDLTLFSRWYSQSGTPVVSVMQQYDAASKQLTLTVKQHTAATADQLTKQPLLLPLAIELLFERGNKQKHLLSLTAAEQQFVLQDLPAEPVVVWLEHFSAPVKLQCKTTADELLLIAAKASDGVARWDAMQQYWSRQIAALMQGATMPSVLSDALVATLKQWLEIPGDDSALTAELLTLPDFDTLAEQHDEIPVDAILSALAAIKISLAQQLQPAFQQCLQQLPQQRYRYGQQDVAVRRLRGLCLAYLAQLPSTDGLLQQYYQRADNMTDTMAVLTATQQAKSALFAQLSHAFCQHWQHDALVMDKAFALVATNPADSVFAGIETMLQHQQFSWKNPNRVRALYSAFSMRNPQQFHRLDGKGYRLVLDAVKKLDPINPQVAARLVTPLLSWRRFDKARQQLMRHALQELAAQPSLSNDLYEKVSRSLQ